MTAGPPARALLDALTHQEWAAARPIETHLGHWLADKIAGARQVAFAHDGPADGQSDTVWITDIPLDLGPGARCSAFLAHPTGAQISCILWGRGFFFETWGDQLAEEAEAQVTGWLVDQLTGYDFDELLDWPGLQAFWSGCRDRGLDGSGWRRHFADWPIAYLRETYAPRDPAGDPAGPASRLGAAG